MFCQHCGKPLADGSMFCNYCDGRQGAVPPASATPASPLIIDQLITDREEVVQDSRYGEFAEGQAIRLHVKIESGGPYVLWVIRDGEQIKVFKGIVVENTFDYHVTGDGELGFDSQSVGAPGCVRLQV